MPEIAIIMGSKSDLLSLKGAFDTLNSFNVEFTARVMSAPRTPPPILRKTRKQTESKSSSARPEWRHTSPE